MLRLEPPRSATSPRRSSAPNSSQRGGLAIWNGSWYGGHYTLTYSVLFPPLAALLGPQAVGGAGGGRLLLPLRPPRPRPLGRGGALGDALVRGRRRHPARRRPAHLRPRRRLRARRAALLQRTAAADRRRSPPPAALSPARSPPPSSPASSRSPPLERGRPRQAGRGPGSRRSPSVCVLIPNLAFPNRPVPLRLLLLLAIPLWCGSALFVTRGLRREERQLRRVLAAYLLAATARLAGRRTRSAATRSGSAPSSAARSSPRSCLARPARVSRLVPRPLHGRRPLLAGDRERQPDRPQRRRPLDRRGLLRAASPAGCASTAAGAGVRIEVPPTANHWEAAYLAPGVRARPRLAAAARHDPRRHLLRRRRPHRPPPTAPGCATTAIRYVALPDAPLDYSSVGRAAADPRATRPT